MPDRVKLPRGMSRRYGSIFRQVCEQQNPASIASSASILIKKDLRKAGQAGDQLLTQAAQYLLPLCQDSLLRRTTDWVDEYYQIDNLAMRITGDPYGIELARRASYQVLQKLEGGEQIADLARALKKQYRLNHWLAQFEENILLNGPFHAEADFESVKKHIELVRPHLEQEFEKDLNGEKPSKIEDIFDGDIMQGIFG